MRQFNWSLQQRLKQLKKLSISLKDKVQNQGQYQSETISSILTFVMPNSSQANSILPLSLNKNSHFLHKEDISKKVGFQQSSSTKSLNLSPTNNAGKDKNQDGNINGSTTSYFRPYYSKQYYQQEISKMNHSNAELQSQISKISSQLHTLQQIQTQKQDQVWKQTLPFITLQSTLNIFITRLYVKQSQIQKIDFQNEKTQLFNDKLNIYVDAKSKKIFSLANLTDVKYYKDTTMRFQFTDKETNYVFFSFKSKEEKNEWQYGLFINHKISILIKDMDKSLFEEEKDDLFKKKSKKQLKLKEVQQNLKKSSQRQTIKSSFRKSLKSSNNVFYQSQNAKRSQTQKMENSQYPFNGGNNEANFSNMQITSSHVSLSSNKSKQMKQLTVFHQNNGQDFRQSKANTSRFNQNETISFQNPHQLDIYEPETNHNINKQSQNMVIIQNEYNKNINALKQGYFFKKYSKDGFKPRNKKIFLDSKEDMLICANSDDLNQRKSIPIENIRSVKYPAIGQGIRKHLDTSKMQNFCVIHYRVKGIDKTLQFGCHQMNFIKRFSNQLHQFLSKKGLLIND